MAVIAGRCHRGDPRSHRRPSLSGLRTPLQHQDRRRKGGRSGHAEVLCRNRRSEEHTSELQSLMRISYSVFCLFIKIFSLFFFFLFLFFFFFFFFFSLFLFSFFFFFSF